MIFFGVTHSRGKFLIIWLFLQNHNFNEVSCLNYFKQYFFTKNFSSIKIDTYGMLPHRRALKKIHKFLLNHDIYTLQRWKLLQIVMNGIKTASMVCSQKL